MTQREYSIYICILEGGKSTISIYLTYRYLIILEIIATGKHPSQRAAKALVGKL